MADPTPLPERAVQAVRLSRVPAGVRALVRRLGPIDLEITLDDGEPHKTIAELLRLAQLEPDHALLLVERGKPGVRVGAEGRSQQLEPDDLDRGLEHSLQTGLALTMSREALFAAALLAATELTYASAVNLAATAILEADGQEAAIGALLSAMTSKDGLGFRRAAMFVFDRAANGYACVGAVGPGSEREATRVEATLGSPGIHGPLYERWRGIELPAGSHAGDEIAAAVGGAPALLRHKGALVSPALARLHPPPELVLTRIAIKDHTFGLLYADMQFTSAALDELRVRAAEMLASRAAVAFHALRLGRDVEEHTRLDPLTSLANRREFEVRLAFERSRGRRSNEPVSVLVIEIDDLRDAAKRAGMEVGDALLKRVGGLLREELRAHDLGARFAGDTLAVLLPGAGALEAASAARRLGLVGLRREISLSIGVASFPDDTDHPDDLVPLAEQTLEAAIQGGGGRACLSVSGEPIVFSQEAEAAPAS